VFRACEAAEIQPSAARFQGIRKAQGHEHRRTSRILILSAMADVCADVPVILESQDGCFAALLATDKKTGRCCKGVGEEAPMTMV
jgi:hypothetical protein